MGNTLKYIIKLILLFLAQVYIFDKLVMGPYVYICPIILVILIFPFSYNSIYLMLWAFGLGLLIDLFGGGLIGLHTVSIVALAFFRKYLLRPFCSRDDYESTDTPWVQTMGMKFVGYVLVCTLVHDTIHLFVEDASLSMLFHNILRIICSTLVNTIAILIIYPLFKWGDNKGEQSWH